jgi:hypothetical protein
VRPRYQEVYSPIMPISFTSISHGPIPVGFFNIETDLLLMDRYFIFSTDFCSWINEWADNPDLTHEERGVYAIQNRDKIGNLAGAIYGFEFTGFIGVVYKMFPFPENPSGFKQKPYGRKNREIIETAIQPFAVRLKIPIDFSRSDHTIALGDYLFSKKVFQEILQYVQAGGMPGWLDGNAPDYVGKMTEQVTLSQHWFFSPNS